MKLRCSPTNGTFSEDHYSCSIVSLITYFHFKIVFAPFCCINAHMKIFLIFQMTFKKYIIISNFYKRSQTFNNYCSRFSYRDRPRYGISSNQWWHVIAIRLFRPIAKLLRCVYSSRGSWYVWNHFSFIVCGLMRYDVTVRDLIF